MSRVLARKELTLILPVGPTSIPLVLMRNILPFAVRLPYMAEGSTPITRFRAIEDEPGWKNLTASGCAMLKLCQLIMVLFVS